MSETLLHYGGLKTGDHSWYYNRRGASVEVRPGDWLRIDLSRHSEVLPAIQAGSATIERTAPPEADILDEDSCANREANPYGKVFYRHVTRRSRSRGRPEIFRISIDQLDVAARCFLPWAGWQKDLAGLFTVTEDRPHDRGARSSVMLPIVFDKNFAVLHRIAELISRSRLRELRAARVRAIDSGWDSGVYVTKAECRMHYERTSRLPSRGQVVAEVLQQWGVWRRAGAPSSRTLRLYRTMLGATCQIRAYVDEQILTVLTKPCQRILLGEGCLSVGPYAPNRGASPSLHNLGTTGPIVLEISLPSRRMSPSSP